MEHGARLTARPSEAGGFSCHHCGRGIEVGDIVVGFKNKNKRFPADMDHVCAEPCARTYKPPALRPSISVTQRVGAALAGAARAVRGMVVSPPSTPSKELTFLESARALDFGSPAAEKILEEHGGDEEAALQSITTQWHAAQEGMEWRSPPRGGPSGDRPGEGDEELAEEELEEEMLERPAEQPAFSSDDAKRAVLDVFLRFLKPLLPKPQGDGSYVDGNPERLDNLLVTPIHVNMPRAEKLAEFTKPDAGWDEESLCKVRSYFALDAMGLRFVLYLPVVTHRAELARSELFQVRDEETGEVIGVRRCPFALP